MSIDTISKLDLKSMLTTQAPALDFVLPGLIRSTVGLISGAGGIGKSFLTFQLAISIASGHLINVHNAYDNKQTLARKVLWLTAEDDKDILHHRLHSIANAKLHANKQDLANALSYISLFPTVGTNFSLIDFDGAATENMQILHKIIQKEKPEIIFIDTLRRFHDSDENDNGRMSSVLKSFESIAKSYSCAVVLVHHENKSGLNNSDANQSAIRGASAIVDNARWLIRLRAMSSDESKKYFNDEAHELRHQHVCLETSVKSNYGESAGGLWFRKISGGALQETSLDALKINKNSNKGTRNAD